jgi:hypothetical protein
MAHDCSQSKLRVWVVRVGQSGCAVRAPVEIHLPKDQRMFLPKARGLFQGIG